MTNYRTIAITLIFFKICETTLKSRIVDYFGERNLWNPAQYGFCRGRATVIAVSKILEEAASAFDRKYWMELVC